MSPTECRSALTQTTKASSCVLKKYGSLYGSNALTKMAPQRSTKNTFCREPEIVNETQVGSKYQCMLYKFMRTLTLQAWCVTTVGALWWCHYRIRGQREGSTPPPHLVIAQQNVTYTSWSTLVSLTFRWWGDRSVGKGSACHAKGPFLIKFGCTLRHLKPK